MTEYPSKPAKAATPQLAGRSAGKTGLPAWERHISPLFCIAGVRGGAASTPPFKPRTFPASPGKGKKLRTYRKSEIVFTQGEPADSVCYIREGRVKLTVSSAAGKEAVAGLPGPGEFHG